MEFNRSVTAILIFLCGLAGRPVQGVEIRDIDYQGRPHFQVITEQAIYYYDKAGGGFSRLIDVDGRDWIGFRKEPLSKYPESAAAGYRGLPNAVFVGPDKGAGHPGFDQCTSQLAAPDTIRTESKSGAWTWTWRFSAAQAEFQMEQADPEQPWWFLYEGPIAGSFAPSEKHWATDTQELTSRVPTSGDKAEGRWQWLVVGDREVPRFLLIFQETPDVLPDTLWYLGSSQGGSPEASDGMVVVGFGRTKDTRPQFKGAGQRFTIRLLEVEPREITDDRRVREKVRRVLAGKANPGASD